MKHGFKESGEAAGRLDVSGEQAILKVGSEGGSITLLGINTDGVWKYRLATNEAALHNELVDDVKTAERPWVDTWEEALQLLDQYPWHMLYPLGVHLSFHDHVYEALEHRQADTADIDWGSWKSAMAGGDWLF
ncbi:hypothetical protein [Marinobacter sp.]|uniref:hypothetical protein n=1 Tax=Marinobacter sp. TaxID=50741 RepID=UPI003A9191D4